MTPALPRLRRAAALALAGAGLVGAAPSCRRAPTLTPSAELVTTVKDVGFAAPENLVYDAASDVYLVSNMNGDGATRDGNGFISRVAPTGRVVALRWIAGGERGAVLDSPKGLAIHGDTLAVADLGAVRLFDRRTGAPLGAITVPGLVMNDVAFAPDGSIWVTDTGPDRSGTTPVDTSKDMDAVWRVTPDGGSVHAVARGLALDRPDGLVLDGGDAIVATFGANRLERVAARGTDGTSILALLPGGRVDGLRRLPDGAFVVTSWDARAVWRLAAGPPRPLLAEVTSPAGVAVDTKRHQLAVTSMQRDELYILPLP